MSRGRVSFRATCWRHWLLLLGCVAVLGVTRGASAADDAPAARKGGATAAPSEAGADEPISTARYVTAGVLGTFPGYGIGHAVAGEWSETGWIFTFGELTAAILIGVTDALSGLSDTGPEGPPIALFVVYGAFRVVEIVDIWTRPTVRSETVRSEPEAARAMFAPSFTALPVLRQDGASVVFVGSF
jgi:hypothetical protein